MSHNLGHRLRHAATLALATTALTTGAGAAFAGSPQCPGNCHEPTGPTPTDNLRDYPVPPRRDAATVPGPPDYQSSDKRPEFNDYLACVPSPDGKDVAVYADFVDPDGPDAKLDVEMEVMHVGHWHPVEMAYVPPTPPHGHFWWASLKQHGIAPASVVAYRFRATDEDGLTSEEIVANATCEIIGR